MKETITRLKTIISLIENGEIKGESLNEINRFFDSIMAENENPQLKIDSEKSLSYREELKNMDKNLILRHIVVNKSLLNRKKEQIITQLAQDKNDTEKCIQLLSVNECVLENIKDFKSDRIEEKLLFSHWKMSPEKFLIDFKTNNEIWDYASTVSCGNIYDITTLGLDIQDDFDGGLWSLKEPQRSIVDILSRQPFNKPIFVFFVNRNNIYYLDNIHINYPKCNETKNIIEFGIITSKLYYKKVLPNLFHIKDEQLLHVSKMFDKSLKQIPNELS